MKTISFSEILNLNINPLECVSWAKNAVIHKNDFESIYQTLMAVLTANG